MPEDTWDEHRRSWGHRLNAALDFLGGPALSNLMRFAEFAVLDALLMFAAYKSELLIIGLLAMCILLCGIAWISRGFSRFLGDICGWWDSDPPRSRWVTHSISGLAGVAFGALLPLVMFGVIRAQFP